MLYKHCRICMTRTCKYSCFSRGENSVRYKMMLCVPEIDMSIISDPVLCSWCTRRLEVAYSFKLQCLDTEDRIAEYVKDVKPETLHIKLAAVIKIVNNKLVQQLPDLEDGRRDCLKEQTLNYPVTNSEAMAADQTNTQCVQNYDAAVPPILSQDKMIEYEKNMHLETLYAALPVLSQDKVIECKESMQPEMLHIERTNMVQVAVKVGEARVDDLVTQVSNTEEGKISYGRREQRLSANDHRNLLTLPSINCPTVSSQEIVEYAQIVQPGLLELRLANAMQTTVDADGDKSIIELSDSEDEIYETQKINCDVANGEVVMDHDYFAAEQYTQYFQMKGADRAAYDSYETVACGKPADAESDVDGIASDRENTVFNAESEIPDEESKVMNGYGVTDVEIEVVGTKSTVVNAKREVGISENKVPHVGTAVMYVEDVDEESVVMYEANVASKEIGVIDAKDVVPISQNQVRYARDGVAPVKVSVVDEIKQKIARSIQDKLQRTTGVSCYQNTNQPSSRKEKATSGSLKQNRNKRSYSCKINSCKLNRPEPCEHKKDVVTEEIVFSNDKDASNIVLAQTGCIPAFLIPKKQQYDLTEEGEYFNPTHPDEEKLKEDVPVGGYEAAVEKLKQDSDRGFKTFVDRCEEISFNRGSSVELHDSDCEIIDLEETGQQTSAIQKHKPVLLHALLTKNTSELSQKNVPTFLILAPFVSNVVEQQKDKEKCSELALPDPLENSNVDCEGSSAGSESIRTDSHETYFSSYLKTLLESSTIPKGNTPQIVVTEKSFMCVECNEKFGNSNLLQSHVCGKPSGSMGTVSAGKQMNVSDGACTQKQVLRSLLVEKCSNILTCRKRRRL